MKYSFNEKASERVLFSCLKSYRKKGYTLKKEYFFYGKLGYEIVNFLVRAKENVGTDYGK